MCSFCRSCVKLCGAPGFWEFFGFYIETAYSNFTFCGTYTIIFLARHTISAKWAHPCFWTSGDISSGFQSQLGGGICITCSLRFTSGITPLDGQHGSQEILFHIPVSRYWMDLKLGSIMPPLTVWDQAGQTLYQLSYVGSANRFFIEYWTKNWGLVFILRDVGQSSCEKNHQKIMKEIVVLTFPRFIPDSLARSGNTYCRIGSHSGRIGPIR